MSAPMHTPEPWSYSLHTGSDNSWAVRPAVCYEIYNEANAARIVTCVNACAGMDDPAHGIRETVVLADRMTRKAFDAENQRDQLLAALQRLLRERAAYGRPKPSTWAETAAMLAGMGVEVYTVDGDSE